MKHVSEKKQDLLLDALSCIDEDILERGLALREGAAVSAAEAGVSTPVSAESEAFIPPLYDLTRRPEKPPRKNPWRVLAVVAAACLLLCVVPLSLWTVGRFVDNPDKAEDADGTMGNHGGIQNGVTSADGVPNEPGDGWGDNEAPEMEAPAETDENTFPEGLETDGFWEAETELGNLVAIYPHDPKPLSWNVTSNTNYKTQKNTEITLPGSPNRTLSYHYTADVTTFWGSQEEMKAFSMQTVSPEDELVLDLYAQYCASLYSMDYGSHFLLFHPDIVKSRFTQEVEPYPYDYALGKINYLAGLMLPYDIIGVSATLTQNRLLAGDELTEYLANQQKNLGEVGLSVDRITAVRCFSIYSIIMVESYFRIEDHERDMTLYCYEYNGVWYLDDSYMDDDLCIDFVLSDITEGEGYRQIETRVGTVVAMDDTYLYLDTGEAFRVDSALFHNQTDGGEWQIRVGDTVTVNHYSPIVKVTRTVDGVENKEWTLATATEVNYFG